MEEAGQPDRESEKPPEPEGSSDFSRTKVDGLRLACQIGATVNERGHPTAAAIRSCVSQLGHRSPASSSGSRAR
jgi:hypothetical protein